MEASSGGEHGIGRCNGCGSRLARDHRYCIECGTLFALQDRRAKAAEFCSDGCSSRSRQDGKRPTKRDRLDAHVAKCLRCKAHQPCRDYDLIVDGGSARTISSRSRPLRNGEKP